MASELSEFVRRDPAEPDPGRVRRIGLTTGVLLLLAFTIDYVDRFAISIALPTIGTEFGLSNTMRGLLVTVFAVVYMLSQIPAGVVTDRIGSRVLLLVTLVLWSGFTLLTAAAAGLAMLLVVRGLFGASQGFFPAASFKTISERTTPDNRGRATGLMMSASGIGAGVTPLIAVPLLVAFGWRGMFVWLAVAGVVLGVLIWLCIPKPLPARMRDVGPQPVRPSPAARRAVLRSPQVWLLAGVFCASNFVLYGLITWAPSYLQVARGIPIAQTGLISAVPLLVTFLTTIIGGWLFDRYFRERTRWYLFTILLVSGAFLIPMALATSLTQFIVFETLAAGIGGLGSMALVGLPMRVLPSALTGSGMGVFNFGGQVAGVLAPVLLGVLVDYASYGAAFGLLALSSLVAAGLALCMPQRPDQFAFTHREA